MSDALRVQTCSADCRHPLFCAALFTRRVSYLRTLTNRMQADLDHMKAVVKNMEELAKAGTHGDLPGNGQDRS